MAESIFSPYWYRAADLQPRLISTLQITRQIFHGEPWYVLGSKTSNRQYRINPSGYELVGRLDGSQTLQQIWDCLVRKMGNEAPSQHEILAILSELTTAGMLVSGQSMELGGIFESARRHKDANGTRLNPMSFKVPLFDPSPFLTPLLPLARLLFTPLCAAILMLLIATAAILSAMHWPELRDYGVKHLTSHSNLLMMWLAYPLIKVLHEFGHALAIRLWGGEVHELGITLFLLTPVPYVDASAASSFTRKRHRMMVSAMGVIVELAIGSLALLAWLTISNGALRELCFACLSVCSLSSLLINANPLMRFDGYYFITDTLELPGLATRANQYLLYLGERLLLGNRLRQSPLGPHDSAPLLVSYGIAALIYRTLLLAGVALWICAKQFVLGIGFGLWIGIQYALLPLYRLIVFVTRSSRLAEVRTRAVVALALLTIVPAGFVLFYPAPYVTRVLGQVWVPDEAIIRNDVEGFVDKVFATNGEGVSAGREIIRLANPDLVAARTATLARLAGQQQAYQGSLLKDRADTVTLGQEIEKLNHQLQEIDRRLAALSLHAPRNGTLSLPQEKDLAGRYFSRGSVMAELISPEKMTIRLVLSQQDIDLLRDPRTKFHVRIAENRRKTLSARLVAQQPSAIQQLPSAIFSTQLGGPFMTDPTSKDGLRTLESVFIVDIEVPGHPLARIGSRAWVHIDHPPTPLAVQWWRSLQQLFLRNFGAGKAPRAQEAA